MTTTKIKVSDFIKASKTYVEKSLEKANANRNAYLSPSEQKKLPKDLRDNLKNAQRGRTGSVKTKEFATAFTSYVAVQAKKADANKDGVLSAADAGRLPRDLRDNFKNYVAASKQVWHGGPKDKTSSTRIAQHLAAYGTSPISYSDAFGKGVKALLEDREYGPGNILKEIGDGNGNPLTDKQIRAQLEKAFTSMTLLPVGESSESGFDPEAEWVFEVDCDVGSDHGFWVAVNRQSGETQVTNFN